MAATVNQPQYIDFSMAFSANPITGDITKVYDADDIKLSVIHLVLTNHFERPFHPEIGGNIRAMLFENYTSITTQMIQREIQDVITNFEPRATNVSVVVVGDPDNNGVNVTVTFTPINSLTAVTVTSFLERAR